MFSRVLFVLLLGNCPQCRKDFCCFPASNVLQDTIMSDQPIVISSDDSEGSDQLPNVKYPRYVLPVQRTHFKISK